MKFQWTWIISIIFAIIIAIFSVVNVDSVRVNYVFGVAEWPLVLVILGSALLGAAVSGFVALFRMYSSRHGFKELQKEIHEKAALITVQQSEIKDLKRKLPTEMEPRKSGPTLEANELIVEVNENEQL